MLLDQQTPKVTSTRHRGQKQFPHLEGYNGPAPPDMATIIARQDEIERQNSASDPESDHDSASSASLDDASSVESPMKRINPKLDKAISTVPPKQTNMPTLATQTAPDATGSMRDMPDIVLYSEDLAKGRENASKLRASFEAEKASEVETLQTSLAEERQRVIELEEQLAGLREGYNTRINTEKQEHERAMTALKGSLDKSHKALVLTVANVSNDLQAKEKEMETLAKSHEETIKRMEASAKSYEDTIKRMDASLKAKVDRPHDGSKVPKDHVSKAGLGKHGMLDLSEPTGGATLTDGGVNRPPYGDRL